MSEQFNLEEMEKRIREKLKPRPFGSPLLRQLRETAKKRKLPKLPKI